MDVHQDDYSQDCDRDDCRAVVNKNVEVKTPVEVDVRTRTGNIRVVCSRPRIIESEPPSNRGDCEFTISQRISVEIPISYRVRTDVKSSYVNCDVGSEC